jgi:hypothetical protein
MRLGKKEGPLELISSDLRHIVAAYMGLEPAISALGRAVATDLFNLLSV